MAIYHLTGIKRSSFCKADELRPSQREQRDAAIRRGDGSVPDGGVFLPVPVFTELSHAGHGGDQRLWNITVVDMWMVYVQLLSCGTS